MSRIIGSWWVVEEKEMSLSRSIYLVDASGHLGPTLQSGLAFSGPRTESRRICHVLGLRDEETRNKLTDAVRRASVERSHALMMVGVEARRMVSVRPAREAGWAVVTCTDVAEAMGELETSALAELFPLSPAEAEIAILLAQGSTIGDVAERRLVQQETVRGQVKGILRKTGVANQKQLAALLAQVAVALRDLALTSERAGPEFQRAAS